MTVMVLRIIIGLLVFYGYASAFIVAYSIWKKRDLNEKPILGYTFLNASFFLIGMFIALIIFFQGGFERTLFFLPDSFGRFDEEGDWQSNRQGLSSVLAFFFSLFFTDQISKIPKKRQRIKELEEEHRQLQKLQRVKALEESYKQLQKLKAKQKD